MTRNEIIMQDATQIAQATTAAIPIDWETYQPDRDQIEEMIEIAVTHARTRDLIERSRVWNVSWNIDVEGAATPQAAAERVWVEQFGRSPQPAADEACVFLVKSALTGDSVLVDLSEVAA